MARLSFKWKPLHQMLHILLETPFLWISPSYIVTFVIITLAGIRKLFLGNLVTGLKLDLKAEPDPVCEACKAGKMHADSFPTLSMTPPTSKLFIFQSASQRHLVHSSNLRHGLRTSLANGCWLWPLALKFAFGFLSGRALVFKGNFKRIDFYVVEPYSYWHGASLTL